MGQTEYIVCPLCFRNRVRRPVGNTWEKLKHLISPEVAARKEHPEKSNVEVRFDGFDCSVGAFAFVREWGGKIAGTRIGRGKAEPLPPQIVSSITLAEAKARPEYTDLIAQMGNQLSEIQGCLGADGGAAPHRVMPPAGEPIKPFPLEPHIVRPPRKMSVGEARQALLAKAEGGISQAKDSLQELYDELEEKRANMEEHFSATERYTRFEEAIGAIEGAIEALEGAGIEGIELP